MVWYAEPAAYATGLQHATCGYRSCMHNLHKCFCTARKHKTFLAAFSRIIPRHSQKRTSATQLPAGSMEISTAALISPSSLPGVRAIPVDDREHSAIPAQHPSAESVFANCSPEISQTRMQSFFTASTRSEPSNSEKGGLVNDVHGWHRVGSPWNRACPSVQGHAGRMIFAMSTPRTFEALSRFWLL